MNLKTLFKLVVATLPLMTGACAMVRNLASIGTPPKLAPITNPTTQRGYEPVSMPMPRAPNETPETNSLWRPGAKAFFRDQRAAKVGDILTVNISIDDSAKLDNSTTRTRTGTENMGVNNLFGLESTIAKALPGPYDTSSLIDTSSDSATKGDGQIDRQEAINLTMAAIVTQVLPNGNLVIEGHQEVLVNFEKRELYIAGIVRPEDISNANTISDSQIAEERVSYGGQGEISRLQQPRYGQQIIDAVSPF